MKKFAAVLVGSSAIALASLVGTGTASADPITDAVGPQIGVAPAATPQEDYRRGEWSGIGAGIGAVTGSAVGSLSGAAAGAAAGGALGYGLALGTEKKK